MIFILPVFLVKPFYGDAYVTSVIDENVFTLMIMLVMSLVKILYFDCMLEYLK